MCVINCNLTLNIKLCKRRFSFTFYFAPVGNYKIVILDLSLKLDSLILKLYVDLKNGFNLENPIIRNSVYPYTKLCKQKLSYFLPNYSLQLETSGAYKIFIFRSKSLIKSGLYVDFKNGLNLENPITNESVDPYSPFFKTPCICLYFACLSVSIQ